ncbi:hypothetical protein Aazo_0669 ['Nostoc azollae' 0708]|uniref:Uncharacterized protein n=1 Tax=Nostoc azollae (strain 0708) TaxID=551115 RepID=D7E108_NOSA0|nr:hypothetical protein Aazo_0669 ['Nostoc azollae' 0708]
MVKVLHQKSTTDGWFNYLKHMQPLWNNQACERNYSINSFQLWKALSDLEFLLPVAPCRAASRG